MSPLLCHPDPEDPLPGSLSWFPLGSHVQGLGLGLRLPCAQAALRGPSTQLPRCFPKGARPGCHPPPSRDPVARERHLLLCAPPLSWRPLALGPLRPHTVQGWASALPCRSTCSQRTSPSLLTPAPGAHSQLKQVSVFWLILVKGFSDGWRLSRTEEWLRTLRRCQGSGGRA